MATGKQKSGISEKTGKPLVPPEEQLGGMPDEDDEPVQKSTEGEGSRGGHVIGHTGKGKPIYESKAGPAIRTTIHPNIGAHKHHDEVAPEIGKTSTGKPIHGPTPGMHAIEKETKNYFSGSTNSQEKSVAHARLALAHDFTPAEHKEAAKLHTEKAKTAKTPEEKKAFQAQASVHKTLGASKTPADLKATKEKWGGVIQAHGEKIAGQEKEAATAAAKDKEAQAHGDLARAATKTAEASGSAEDHKKAMEVHKEAAAKFEAAGNADKAGDHEWQADQHAKQVKKLGAPKDDEAEKSLPALPLAQWLRKAEDDEEDDGPAEPAEPMEPEDTDGEGDDMEKSTEGEGSRGGHIIGHTGSGKPIYMTVVPEKAAGRLPKPEEYRAKRKGVSDAHAGFTAQDHIDAQKVHQQHMDAIRSQEDAEEAKPSPDHGKLAALMHQHMAHEAAQTMHARLQDARHAQGDPRVHALYGTQKSLTGGGTMTGGLTDWLVKAGIPGAQDTSGGEDPDELKEGQPSMFPKDANGSTVMADSAKGTPPARGEGKSVASTTGGTPDPKNESLGDSQNDPQKVGDLEDKEPKPMAGKSTMDMTKSTSGEGSRGGKVIGHTGSGKPIYAHPSHPGHAGFTPEEHKEAATKHAEKLNTLRAQGKGSSAAAKVHKDGIVAHNSKSFAPGQTALAKSTGVLRGQEELATERTRAAVEHALRKANPDPGGLPIIREAPAETTEPLAKAEVTVRQHNGALYSNAVDNLVDRVMKSGNEPSPTPGMAGNQLTRSVMCKSCKKSVPEMFKAGKCPSCDADMGSSSMAKSAAPAPAIRLRPRLTQDLFLPNGVK